MNQTERPTRAYFRPDPVIEWVASVGLALFGVVMVGLVVGLIASLWRAFA